MVLISDNWDVFMVRSFRAAVFAVVVLTAATARAGSPGLAEKVYGARVEAGVTEFEARYGRLSGKADDGETGLILEAEHGFSKRFSASVFAEFEREPGNSLKLEEVAVEGVYTLGRIPGIGVDVAVYGELGVPVRGDPVVAELKALFQKTTGPVDLRLNLIAARSFVRGPVAFGYAASADVAIIGDDIRLGGAIFGDLGDTDRFGGRQQTFAGPIAKFEIEHLPGNSDLEIETGYLFALGAARDDARGQFRLLIDWETRF